MNWEWERRRDQFSELFMKAKYADPAWVVFERMEVALHSIGQVFFTTNVDSSITAIDFDCFHLDHLIFFFFYPTMNEK